MSAGFPCQNFSHAGDQNTDDDRNMWPETLETIGTVHPPLVILENVANLVTGGHGYFGEVLGGLAENRYNAVWTCLPASDLGANHERERVWILAWRQGLADPDRKRLEKFYTSAVTGKLGQHTRGTPADGARSGLGVEPRPPGVADGVADRMDRTRAAGNGLVPQQMAVAFTMLTREVLRETKP
ncbi:MAG: DNA cytosine methyltransferase [Bradymonadaceae bacterium]